MRTALRAALAVAIVSVLIAAPSTAEEATTAPIGTTLYLHGAQQIGELETADTWLTANRRMSESEPTGSDSKSMQVVNYVRGPNTNCSGNGLVPTWEANLEGTISGPVTLTVHTAGVPGSTMQARLFSDVGMNACNESFVPPIAEKTVRIAPGQAETVITFDDVQAEVGDNLVLMLNAPTTNVVVPEQPSPSQPFAHTRVFYDAVPTPSNLQFDCIPLTDTATTCIWG